MRTSHYFAPGTVVQLPAPRKPSRRRVALLAGGAALVIWYLIWFWQMAFDWLARMVEGLL